MFRNKNQYGYSTNMQIIGQLLLIARANDATF